MTQHERDLATARALIARDLALPLDLAIRLLEAGVDVDALSAS